MDLEFSKNGTYYEAEATINGDFNLRLERAGKGVIEIWGSTVEDAVPAKMYEVYADGTAFEKDFKVLVAPKYLTIKSTSEVNTGIITEA